MRIVVAGSNGFLGKNFKKYFSAKSIHDVSYISRADLDLSDSESLAQYCRTTKPDILIHCAVSLSDFKNNILMYLALERCSQFCGKVIMIGSGAEYSHQRYKPLMTESYYAIDQPPANKNTYHLSKHMISRLHIQSNICNIYNFRVFGLYGPYEDHTRRLISNNIFNYLQTGSMYASANHAFDYLFVDDLISAIVHFCTYKNTPVSQTYNVCSGRSDRFYDILSDVITSLGGSKDSINMESSIPTDLDYSGDNSLFEDEFEYKIEQTSYSQSSLIIKEWISTEILPNCK